MANRPLHRQNWVVRFWKKIGLQTKVILLVVLGCLAFLALALGSKHSGLQNSLLPHAGGATIPGVDP
jgi:hypothetical protein